MGLIADTIQAFSTFEKREEAFLRAISALLPRSHAGPRVFWKDFSRVLGGMDDPHPVDQVAYVTANPRDCLAFSTPRQVLLAAGMQAGRLGQGRVDRPENIAGQFGLENNLAQPIRTLSGGETVKLALAKVNTRAATADRLAMASPFCWLDRYNHGFLNKVLRTYRKREIPTKLFTLKGEDDTRLIANHQDLGDGWSKSPCFDLTTEKLRLTLGSTLAAFNMPPPPEVRVNDFEARLSSPCLWIGGNGQGKSLIARVVSGAMAVRGTARITGPNGSQITRLIFQDVISQTLLRSFNAIRSHIGGAGVDRVEAVYRQIVTFINHMNPSGSLDPSGPAKAKVPTILETKVILVAVRLAHSPGALILDEPDWGLSREASKAFVAAVVNVSHGLDVPVILITHKPWWDAAVNSRVRIMKSGVKMDKGRVTSFEIRMENVSHA
jgi:energy-coupling factor transporter ATP-binding protein EcfA2